MPKTIEERLKTAYDAGEVTAAKAMAAIEQEPEVRSARAALAEVVRALDEIGARDMALAVEELDVLRYVDPAQRQYNFSGTVDAIALMKAEERHPELRRERRQIAIQIAELSPRRVAAKVALDEALVRATDKHLRPLVAAQTESLITHASKDHAVRVVQNRLHEMTGQFFEPISWPDFQPSLPDGTVQSRLEARLLLLRDAYHVIA